MEQKSLLGIETFSTAFGYQLLNEVLENDWLELVEISSAGNAKNFMLFQTNDPNKAKTLKLRILEKYGEPTKSISKTLSQQLFDICLIDNAHSNILSALVSMIQNPVEEALMIYESESICSTIQAMQLTFQDHSLKLCDLRLVRQSGGINHLFLTGKLLNCEAAAIVLKQHLFANYLAGHVEVVRSPNQRVRELFCFAK